MAVSDVLNDKETLVTLGVAGVAVVGLVLLAKNAEAGRGSMPVIVGEPLPPDDGEFPPFVDPGEAVGAVLVADGPALVSDPVSQGGTPVTARLVGDTAPHIELAITNIPYTPPPPDGAALVADGSARVALRPLEAKRPTPTPVTPDDARLVVVGVPIIALNARRPTMGGEVVAG